MNTPANQGWVIQQVLITKEDVTRFIKYVFIILLILQAIWFIPLILCFVFGICGDACASCGGEFPSDACTAQQCDWNSGNITVLNSSVTEINQTFYECGILNSEGMCNFLNGSCTAEQCEWNSGNITVLNETVSSINQTLYECGILDEQGMCANMSAVWNGIANSSYAECLPERDVVVFSVFPAVANMYPLDQDIALSFSRLNKGWIDRSNDPADPGPCRGACAFEMVCSQEYPDRVAYGNYSFLLTSRNSSVDASSVGGGVLSADHSDIVNSEQSILLNGAYNRIQNSSDSLIGAGRFMTIECGSNSGSCAQNVLLAGDNSSMQDDVRGNLGVGYNHTFSNCSQNYLFGHSLQCISNTDDITNSSAALPVLIVGDNNDVTSFAVSTGAMLVVAHDSTGVPENLMVMSANRNLYLSTGASVIIGGAFVASAHWMEMDNGKGAERLPPGTPVQRLSTGLIAMCSDPERCDGVTVHPRWAAQHTGAAETHWHRRWLWSSAADDWVLNPQWRAEQEYVPRSARGEWNLVATSGRVLVNKGYVDMLYKHPRWAMRLHAPVDVLHDDAPAKYVWMDI